ncbi:hypothetical protein OE88DRAFT_530262 [Heliocybe sulcata]|uniref:Uncharacterized protein n=1 Tax=Heliocybe sulcata TaxID=5364 RepID=A0A5C3MSY5_9AGAM|nr:hypothetical protein OE88DRAFT_530262 [Heliocybe sulcata]
MSTTYPSLRSKDAMVPSTGVAKFLDLIFHLSCARGACLRAYKIRPSAISRERACVYSPAALNVFLLPILCGKPNQKNVTSNVSTFDASRTAMASMPTLVLSKTEGSLFECDANLMPFHVSYSGPAPIKSYFMVKPASSSVGQGPADPVAEIAKSEVDSAVKNAVASSKDGESMELDRTPEVETPPTAGSSSTLLSASSSTTLVEGAGQERYTAAFRGRTVHGLKVALPAGYTGIILRTPDKGKASEEVASTTRGRGSRRNEDDNGEVDEETTLDQLHTRALTATHTFPSFTLWHPDIPVDEGKDEYWRSLKEWAALGCEIHRAD